MASLHVELASKILAAVEGLDGPEVGAQLARVIRGDTTDVSDAILRLAWLTFVREPAANEAGLATAALSTELLQSGSQSLDEFLGDRRVFANGQPAYVGSEKIPISLRWSANYLHGVVDAQGPDLHALIVIVLADIRGDEAAVPAAADDNVIAWIRGQFEPRTAIEHLHLARAIGQTNSDRSRQLLTKGLALDDTLSELHCELGFVASFESGWLAAKAHFEDGLSRMDSPTFEVLYELGRMELQLGALDNAVKAFSQAIDLQPDAQAPLMNRACALSLQERHHDAIVDLNRAIALEPDDPEGYYNRAHAQAQLGHNAEAMADYDRALELHPSYLAALNNRAMLKRQLGDLQGAIEDHTLAIQEAGPDTTLLVNRAETLERANLLEEAIADWSQFIALTQGPTGYAKRAALFHATDVKWRAISDSVSVLRLSTEQDVDTDAALDRLRDLEYEEAIAFPLAVDPAALVQAGFAQEQAGQVEAAAATYEHALNIDPGLTSGLYNLATLKLQSDDLDLAVALCSRAIETHPGDVQSYLNRGTALFQQGASAGSEELFGAAAQDFSAAMSLDPNHPSPYLKLGMMEGLVDRHYSALLLLMTARSLYGSEHPQSAAIDHQLQSELLPAAAQSPIDEGRMAVHGILRGLLAQGVLQAVVEVGSGLRQTLMADEPDVAIYMGTAYWLADMADTAAELFAQAQSVAPTGVRQLLESIVEDGIAPREILELA